MDLFAHLRLSACFSRHSHEKDLEYEHLLTLAYVHLVPELSAFQVYSSNTLKLISPFDP